MLLEFSDIVGIFAFIQLVFLAVVAFNYKKGKRLSNRILAGFMVSNALLIGSFLASRSGWISPGRNLLLYCFLHPSYLLLMPFMFLYLHSLCYEDFRLEKKYLLHFVPFIAMFLFLLVLYAVIGGVEKSSLDFQRLTGIDYWSYKIILHVQIPLYLIASGYMLINYRKRLKDIYSSIEKIDLSWCNLLLAGIAAMWITDILNWILFSFQIITVDDRKIFLIVSMLINLGFTLAVVYMGLIRIEGFSGIGMPARYAGYLMKPEECESIIQKLNELMKREKLHLLPSLTIEELSKRLNVPVKKISQAIHTHFNKNFYEYINSYRIETVKERMLDTGYKNHKLLSLAFDSGFNSKSVFNAAFKKHTGLTPKEFKRLQSSE